MSPMSGVRNASGYTVVRLISVRRILQHILEFILNSLLSYITLYTLSQG